MDLYILRRFFLNFALLMGAFVFLFETFTFFELLDDIARHRVPFLIVVELFPLSDALPDVSAGAAGSAGGSSGNAGNHEQEQRNCGDQGQRHQLVPGGGAAVACGAGAGRDHDGARRHYLPYANQRQDALRNLIKGRPPQTYTHPQRWIFGEDNKIYNYDLFDPAQNLFGGLSVLEIDPATFQLRRRVFASRARWSESQKVWVLEGGWVRDFSDGTHRALRAISAGDFACRS